MENKKVNVYCASGWFTENTREILNSLEDILSGNPRVEEYLPRRDGIMLTPEQRQDTEIRESVFKDNISHILHADLVVANIDSHDSYNDPGTIYEIGYAMANNIPVLGYATDGENIGERFKGILDGFDYLVFDIEDMNSIIAMIYDRVDSKDTYKSKVLFVGAGDDEVDGKLASYIMDSGANLRWINEVHDEVYSRIDEIFENVEYMIAVIDDRKTIVSWMIGQAYARNIPVVTYSNYNYMINIMLLASVKTHLRGADELQRFLQQVKREGLDSIPKLDMSEFDVC